MKTKTKKKPLKKEKKKSTNPMAYKVNKEWKAKWSKHNAEEIAKFNKVLLKTLPNFAKRVKYGVSFQDQCIFLKFELYDIPE